MYQGNGYFLQHVGFCWWYKIIIFSFFVLFSLKIFSNEEEWQFQFNRGFTDITSGIRDMMN